MEHECHYESSDSFGVLYPALSSGLISNFFHDFFDRSFRNQSCVDTACSINVSNRKGIMIRKRPDVCSGRKKNSEPFPYVRVKVRFGCWELNY